MKTIDAIINDVLTAEGGYVDNPNDKGGKTKFGIIEKVARASGYVGDMRDLPESMARKIYFEKYVIEPGFDQVLDISPVIAAELVDTGVNMGPEKAVEFLQRSLNAFNMRGAYWPELLVDKNIRPSTLGALTAYMKKRGDSGGELVMLRALNSMQAARYIELAYARPENEDFVYGWIRNRVVI
jgi:lysozyme family protein